MLFSVVIIFDTVKGQVYFFYDFPSIRLPLLYIFLII